MPQFPETRFSLFLRLRDRADPGAWAEFCLLYEPVILRLARASGLQEADARDLTQDVLAKVWRVLDTWDHDPKRGQFRTWLHRVVRNQWIDSLRKLRPGSLGSGDTGVHEDLAQKPEAIDEAIDWEVRRELFLAAAEKVRGEVAPATWEAFWRTCVGGQPLEKVAKDLSLRLGSVYAARSRIMARIRAAVEEADEPPIGNTGNTGNSEEVLPCPA